MQAAVHFFIYNAHVFVYLFISFCQYYDIYFNGVFLVLCVNTQFHSFFSIILFFQFSTVSQVG